MEWKTSTGGETALVLDPGEEQWLRRVSRERGEKYDATRSAFERLRRDNPLASFEDLTKVFFPVGAKTPSLVPDMMQQAAGPDMLDDLVALDEKICIAMRQASSIQVEALLLQARATTLQAIAITTLLDQLNSSNA